MDSLVVGLPLLPFIAAVLIGCVHFMARRQEAFTAYLTLAALALVTLIAGVLLLGDYLGKMVGTLHIGAWLKSEDLEVSLNLVSVGFPAQTAAVCALLLLVIARFSITHLQGIQGFHRYFFGFNLFASALFLLLLADNLLIIFIAWYTTCVCAYSLIAYAYTQPVAVLNATRVFLTHRLGDAFFLLGIGFSYGWLGTVNLADVNQLSTELALNESTALALCFAIAASVRSALFPFSAWLTRAMEGPNASSAALFGAMFSHSGVFLLVSLRLVLEHSPLAMLALIVFGAITAVYGWVVSLTQTDQKSALSFAIIGQLGLIFIECGMDWWQIAVWHTLVHMTLRAYQILHILSFLQQTQDLPAPLLMPRFAKIRWAYVVSLQRFWLDPLTDWLLVNPILSLGQDLSYFDDHMVNALMGTPAPAMNALATLAQLEEHRQGLWAENEPESFAKGSGLAGKWVERLAGAMQWVEQRLVLRFFIKKS